MKTVSGILTAIIFAMATVSCSTTRVLQDGEYRLARNRITVDNPKEFNVNKLEPYLKQKPNSYFIFGWNPFLNVYNWSNGKGKGWDRFVQKIGVAPVVYDPDMVDSSIDNLKNHLTYLDTSHHTFVLLRSFSADSHSNQFRSNRLIDLPRL